MGTIKKRLLLLFTLLFLMLFLLVNLAHSGFEGDCEINLICDTGETQILSIAPLPDSGQTNQVYAHASADLNEFSYKLCCPSSGINICSDPHTLSSNILSLSTEGQAGSGGTSPTFPTPVCIESDTLIQCRPSTLADPCPTADYPYCILRLSGSGTAGDSHVADCSHTDFTTPICCNTFYPTSGLEGYEIIGYCPLPTQCLRQINIGVTGDNNPLRYSCTDSGDYHADNYCSTGTWSSRTNLIALQLFDLVDQKLILHASDGYIVNYTLYCDNKNNQQRGVIW